MDQTPRLLDWLDKVIHMGRTAQYPTDADGHVLYAPWEKFRAAARSFVSKVFDKKHPHWEALEKQLEGYRREDCEAAVGILEVMREEIEGGWIVPLRELLVAELFTDFLDMAEHLLDQGYKDPAAVMIGSVLEEHLRQLAERKGISLTFEKDGKQIPKKADTLNAELVKAEVYNKLDQKGVTAWLDLRNNAAHGKYIEYTKEQVQLMLQGVLNFVRRVSLK